MNPYDLLNPMQRLIQATQMRVNGFDSIAERAAREFEQSERIRRASDPFSGLTQQMDCSALLMHEIEPFRSIKDEIDAAARRLIHQRETQDRITGIITSTALASATTVHSTYLESLIKNQQALAQAAAREAIDSSRVALEAATQSAFAGVMGGFTERVLSETDFCQTLVRNLTASYSSVVQGNVPTVTPNYDDLIDWLFNGLTLLGAADAELSNQTFLWKFDAWLESLPPNVKKIVIGFIIGLMLLIVTTAVDSCKLRRARTAQLSHRTIPAGPPEDQRWQDNDMCR